MDLSPEYYPIVIVEDRYRGSYSGGQWLAIRRRSLRVDEMTDINGWSPIETAPKRPFRLDGAGLIDLWVVNRDGTAERHVNCWWEVTYLFPAGWWHGPHEQHGDVGAVFGRVTHWREVPLPPVG